MINDLMRSISYFLARLALSPHLTGMPVCVLVENKFDTDRFQACGKSV